MKHTFLLKTLFFLLGLASLPSWAESGRNDYDLDNDGLIEINDWDDLNAIRDTNSLRGYELYGSKVGCPAPRCIGFELTKNLDFDTNADGKLDEFDTFWNNGYGWQPIGDFENPFRGLFEGNGFEIRNLMIYHDDYAGLFGATNFATVRHLAITGPLTWILGDTYTGSLVGRTYRTTLEGIFVTGRVESRLAGYAGGLVGFAEGGLEIRNVFSSVLVGGLKGSPLFSELFDNNLTLGAVLLAGKSENDADFAQDYKLYRRLYLAADAMSTPSARAFTLAQLRCPAAANDTQCASPATLYEAWDIEKDGDQNYWKFEAGKLPGLVLKGKVYRDSDADGLLDSEDKLPLNIAASVDTDGDGMPDRWNPLCDAQCREKSGLVLDQFPNQAAASVDLDVDGRPDSWNPTCGEACRTLSGLTLDTHLLDADNDGLSDLKDTDDNNDGQVDADADSNGLIEIKNFAELDAMRYSLKGLGRQLSEKGALNTTGCPSRVIDEERVKLCRGYELVSDLDFDTNADGKLDATDAYWNGGEGWLPIGDYTQPFSTLLEGNGFVIRNLMVHRNDAGLFGEIHGGVIRRLGMTGPLMSMDGDAYAGSIAARAENILLEGVFATGFVRHELGGGGAGGFIGFAREAIELRNAFTSVHVDGYTGDPLFGRLYSSKPALGAILVSGKSQRDEAFSRDIKKYVDVYWAADVMGFGPTGNGVTLAQLRCAGAANDTQCAPGVTLYKNWDLEKDGDQKYWVFEAGKLPGLVLNGKVYRDSDADGSLDADDKFLLNFAASVDADGDGIPDRWNIYCDEKCREKSGLVLDQFPTDPAASDDLDFDGMPDYWNRGCDQACWSRSSLKLDAYPRDGDNDGLSDLKDTDDNNDGQVDADADSDGLIEIKNFTELDAIRYSLKGLGRQLSEKGALNATGCPNRMIEEQWVKQCRGYELMADLDFDTNADGKLDAADAYWDEGKGWLPIGDYTRPFSALLEGNGYVIRNLMINRSDDSLHTSGGLFAATQGAVIRRMGITGPLMSIAGYNCVGSFAGRVDNTLLEGVFATGKVDVKYPRGCGGGGFVGSVFSGLMIRNAFSSVVVQGSGSNLIYGQGPDQVFGPLLVLGKAEGNWHAHAYQPNVYWAADVFGEPSSGNGVTLAQFRCPGAANDMQCAPGVTLYKNWDLEKDGDQNYWVFEAGKLPGLVLNGKVYRDETVKAAISSSSSRSSSLSSSSVNSSKSSSSKSSSSKSSAASSSGNTQKGGSLGWGFMVVLMLLGCRRRFK